MPVLKDLVVITGTYTDADGKSKHSHINVGSLMQSKDGGKYLLLRKTFNPAGVMSSPEHSHISVSFYDPKDAESKPADKKPTAKKEFVDDDIPEF